jgi:hypothetical protein
MLSGFYGALATVCFTLLGLWFIVVQTRHAEWRLASVHRRRAYAVSLLFALPGLMSLLSLVDPASSMLWRVCFGAIAAGGALILVLVRGPVPGMPGRLAYLAAITIFALIAVVAAVPGLAGHGILVRPLRAEAVLLTALVFLGVNVAWMLMFDDSPSST